MALEFERNVNLEEIDSDALFGVRYLANQTFEQKVIFFGCASISVLVFFCSQFFFNIPMIVSIIIEIIFAAIAVLFGANQCEYLSIGRYLKLLLFKPIKYANYSSSEDIGLMQNAVTKVNNEIAKQERLKDEATEQGQRRMLIMVILLCVGFLTMAIVFKGISVYKSNQIEHHTVGFVYDNEGIET